jgi:hypothetical protein
MLKTMPINSAIHLFYQKKKKKILLFSSSVKVSLLLKASISNVQAPRPLVNRVLISPIILTGLPSNMDESVLSHNFFSSLVFVRAPS